MAGILNLPWFVPAEAPEADRARTKERLVELQAHIEHFPNADYGWVQDYALRAYEETAKSTEYLDAKAEKFITFMSAVAALLVGFLSRSPLPDPFSWLLPLSAFPAIVFIAFAVGNAVSTLKVRRWYDLPKIDTALGYVLYFEQQREKGERAPAPRPAFIAELHRARELQNEVMLAKGRCMARAQELVRWAVFALLLPLLLLILSPALR